MDRDKIISNKQNHEGEQNDVTVHINRTRNISLVAPGMSQPTLLAWIDRKSGLQERINRTVTVHINRTRNASLVAPGMSQPTLLAWIDRKSGLQERINRTVTVHINRTRNTSLVAPGMSQPTLFAWTMLTVTANIARVGNFLSPRDTISTQGTVNSVRHSKITACLQQFIIHRLFRSQIIFHPGQQLIKRRQITQQYSPH